MKQILIKKCPFCNSNAELFNRTSLDFTDENTDDIYDIRCNTAGCYLEYGADWYRSKNEIIDQWNNRQ